MRRGHARRELSGNLSTAGMLHTTGLPDGQAGQPDNICWPGSPRFSVAHPGEDGRWDVSRDQRLIALRTTSRVRSATEANGPRSMFFVAVSIPGCGCVGAVASAALIAVDITRRSPPR
jgi:hypothetical protein